uniref:NADH-ubiquinone oxidoreductase chain 4 n=1 Tax=Nosodendron sp. BMNH 840466 TaxID=904170 RepID=A0A343A474_9COLE|nr:NADH dehydrogenase subunit 4 [Nosodendron sp. BMNH 840466]
MMKFIFMMMFMIPLSLMKMFWLNQFLYFIMFFMFMMNYSFNSLFLNLSMFFGKDLLSYVMILLSIWICNLMLMASYKIYKMDNYYNFFNLIILLLLFFLFCAFSSMNLFMFYLFFEASLIPTLILILGWGYQPERLQAGVYLLFYTMLVSLPALLAILYYYSNYHSLDFFFMNYQMNSVLFYLCINMLFFIKIPMYMFHLWLPKAHVEAPISGSMILAGVMLKLGGYGLMRVMNLFLMVSFKINYFFISLSLFGGVVISLICLRQSDIKSLIAYSSISHMGLVLSSILTINSWGMYGSLLMMIAHGLSSSGLFCLANISYERLLSRSLFINKGLMNMMPSMSLWWFLLISCSMAAPPSLNLLSEILMINSLISWSYLSIFMLMFISFFSAVYSLYLYSYSQHGKLFSFLYSYSFGFIREYLLLFLHWFPLNLLIFKSDWLILWI